MSSDRLADFEARIAALKTALESGLGERARILRALAAKLLSGDEQARAALKTEGHKLRGVAGTYGHADLTDAAAKLEQNALHTEAGLVAQFAEALAQLADKKAKTSPGAPRSNSPQPAVREPASSAPRVSKPPPLPSEPPPGTGRVRPLRVLAIDDDTVTQRLLTLTLRQVGGFEATIVASAQAGLALLAEHEYDVVVSDAMMPDMNGMEFRRTARERGARMPIVMLSAASPDELGWSLAGESMGDWLRKPFRPTELVRELLRITSRR